MGERGEKGWLMGRDEELGWEVRGTRMGGARNNYHGGSVSIWALIHSANHHRSQEKRHPIRFLRLEQIANERVALIGN